MEAHQIRKILKSLLALSISGLSLLKSKYREASSDAQHYAQPERGYNTVFFQLSGPRSVSSTLDRISEAIH